jgi:hypothetical protein
MNNNRTREGAGGKTSIVPSPVRRRSLIGTRTTILDQEGLAKALQSKIENDFGGIVSAAARHAGVSQPTLYRLAIGWRTRKALRKGAGHRSITPSVAKRLYDFLPPEARRSLFLPPGAAYGFFLYSEWLGGALDRAGTKGLAHERYVWDQSPEGPWKGREAEFRRILKRIRRDAPTVGKQIGRWASRLSKVDAECQRVLTLVAGEYEIDRSKQVADSVSPPRFLLSVYRMLEPLLDSAASGWVEFRQDELTVAKFRRFVDAGWKREEVLLKRSTDRHRLERLNLPLAERDPRLARRKGSR